jgi:hypothetical protein
MPQTNETAPSGARLGESAFPSGNCNSSNATKLQVLQEDTNAPQMLPSFFGLVTTNAGVPMRQASAYLRICAELITIGDFAGFCEAGDRFLDAGREFAKLLKLLKRPSIRNHETAARLENEAVALRERADLLEFEARGHRDAASEAQTAERQAGLEKMAASSQGGAP